MELRFQGAESEKNSEFMVLKNNYIRFLLIDRAIEICQYFCFKRKIA